MKRQILLLAALTITAMILSGPRTKTALVIGNGNYKNNFAALANPVPEAEKMAAAHGKHRFQGNTGLQRAEPGTV